MTRIPPAPRPFHTAFTTFGAVQLQGSRKVQADAWAVDRDPQTGRVAAVVSDGIGDREESAQVARIGADYAAAVAARTGSPARAIREARVRRNEIELGHAVYDPEWDYWYGEADAVLAVAVLVPGTAAVRVAWVGDCRVYRLGHTGILQQVTTDHTQGEYLRSNGYLDRDAPLCKADSVVTRRLAYGEIETATIPVELARRVLVCSDGIAKQIEARTIGFDLEAGEDAQDAAWLLAEDAVLNGGNELGRYSDNITSLVLDLAQTPTGRHWSATRNATGGPFAG